MHSTPLPDTVERFVLEWGEIGSVWGINRSIAQIHALLYAMAEPWPAEAIAEHLGLARSNVSNSLKELLSWQLIYRVPVRGDRREHFQAEMDVLQIAMRIAEGRKSRELDPARRALASCMALAASDGALSADARARLQDMHDFVDTMNRWQDDMLSLPPNTLRRLIGLGSKVARFLK